MSDDFKRKLEAYEKGELADSELLDFEKDLEKLESYQEFLEDNHSDEPTKKSSKINDKKQKKILRRGKWKARIQTAFSAVALFLLFTIISSIFTAIYYSWGSPDRVEVFSTVIDHTLTVTGPYGYMGRTSTNVKPYFSTEATRDINKRVGRETKNVGEIKINFILSIMGVPQEKHYGTVSQERASFIHPEFDEEGQSDWAQLEKLTEGTVVSAYVSFSELIGTDRVIDFFEGKDIDLLWLAVNTGKESDPKHFNEPIGFPSSPIWHEDDMILTSHEEEKGPFWSKVVSEGYHSPSYETGDQEMLHKQFMKTLNFLKDHEKKANNLLWGELDLADRIEFLKENGFEHYGVVITGPTKEVLKLQDEPLVGNIDVDEVALWNWDK